MLAACLLSLAPATASVVYCIGQSGHSGFEVVAGGESGCSGCCHDAVEPSGADDSTAASDECTDVLVTLPQDLPRGGIVPANVAAPSLPLHEPVPFASPRGNSLGLRRPAALAPPASSPSALIAFTVLTI